MGYETDEWRRPDIQDGEIVVRSEHGRILGNVDYRSHWFVLIRDRYRYRLLVKHGGGQESIELGRLEAVESTVSVIRFVTSDQAYMLMHDIYRVYKLAWSEGAAETAQMYRLAFSEARLKKRKCKGKVKVWIEAGIEAGIETETGGNRTSQSAVEGDEQ